MNEIEPEYPLNELIDLIIFILSDFCEINPNYNEFIELIIKNHPYINNSRSVIGDIYQLTRSINSEIVKYAKEFREDESFLSDFEDLKKTVDYGMKSVRINKNVN